MNITFRVKKLSVYTIVPVMAATVWIVKNGHQDSLHATLAAGESLTVGPYLNIVGLRVVSQGDVAVEDITENFSDPISPFDYITPAEAVADAASNGSDIVDQFNALLASMRAAGQLAS